MRTRLILCLLCLVITAKAALAADVQRLDLGGGGALDLVLIHAGEFKMGSPAAEAGRRADEEQIDARINEDFYIGKFPVTRAQFARFAQLSGYRTEAETGTSGGFGVIDGKLVQRRDFNWKNPGFTQADEHPVVIVTVKDALAFIKWVSAQPGAANGGGNMRKFALPTETQWEYACRAGATSRFYSGEHDADAASIAWFQTNAGGTTHAVGEKPANAWGLFDMSGNVFEWCDTTYAAYRPGGAVVGDMNQPRNVLRGGSFLRGINDVRSAARYRNSPTSRNADNGFRIVMTMAPAPAAGAVAPAELPPQNTPPIAVELPRRTAGSPPAATVAVPMARPAPAIPDNFQVQELGAGGIAAPLLGGLVCLVLPLAGAALIAFVIYKMLNRSQLPGNIGGGPGRILPAPRITEDGFWVNTSGFSPGSVMRYRYQGASGFEERQFIVEPGDNQFIYTGMSPANLVLMEMAADTISRRRASTPPPPPPPRPSRSTTTDDSGSFRGFPSAY